MSAPKTLLGLSGADPKPTPLSQSAIVVIDAQVDYVSGMLPLSGVGTAMEAGATLLARARALGCPVVHVLHKGAPGGLLDPEAGGRPDPRMAPIPGEAVVWKTRISGFVETDLGEVLAATGVQSLVLVGFMTHMCLSTTTRAASDLGYRCAVIAEVAATRDLPDWDGEGILPAAELHRAALVALSDRFAVILSKVSDLPD